MNKFIIDIVLDKNKYDEIIELRIPYIPNHFDVIHFERNEIIITGNRSSKINYESCLKTVKSNYYRLIVISLLYTYFSKGCYRITSSNIKIFSANEEQSKEFSIKQRFENVIPERLNLKAVAEGLSKEDIKKVDNLIRILSYLNLSISEDKSQKFSYSWKSFNSLLRAISENKTDAKQLNDLRNSLKDDFDKLAKVKRICNELTFNDLAEFQVKPMLLSLQTKRNFKLDKFINEFEDERVCKVLLENISCLRKNQNDFDIQVNHLSRKSEANKKNNYDVANFVILYYAYFLRCKFFHAEKVEVGYLFENYESEQLDKISLCVQILIEEITCHKLINS